MNFKFMEGYRFILVTGPQRSGTTITARMISEDTGLQFLPEGSMAVQDKDFEAKEALPRLIDKLVAAGASAVIQCPIQCRFIHEVGANRMLVVMMRRPLEDIIASEKRIRWGDSRQCALYADIIKKWPHLKDEPIAIVKYFYWEHVQRKELTKRNCDMYELRYDDLHTHKLWIPQEQRRKFFPRQISPDENYARCKVMI